MATLRRYNVKTKTYKDHEIADIVIARSDKLLPDISCRQFFQQLALDGIIPEAEALAAVSAGVLPTDIEAIVASLPPAEQFGARMLLSGAQTFHRKHPLVPVFAAAIGMSDSELDTFWLAASKLQ
ncbi:hypothetical protein Kim5_CH00772 [Rhizobium sp. Kim5]|uniref:hypothetical protein n=1 Tax=Rhizobium sp. Kim5 TaxID=2020311 RepID=UPI000A2A174F|nr:hypothetical protein [Rhizobium sp. Kim5]ARQ56880.1 hypothetical protein Kim5_CH00772 [Rhizobium sp. Kim5]